MSKSALTAQRSAVAQHESEDVALCPARTSARPDRAASIARAALSQHEPMTDALTSHVDQRRSLTSHAAHSPPPLCGSSVAQPRQRRTVRGPEQSTLYTPRMARWHLSQYTTRLERVSVIGGILGKALIATVTLAAEENRPAGEAFVWPEMRRRWLGAVSSAIRMAVAILGA